MARSDSDKIKEVKELIPVLEDIIQRATIESSYTSAYEVYKHSLKTLVKLLRETTK